MHFQSKLLKTSILACLLATAAGVTMAQTVATPADAVNPLIGSRNGGNT